MRGDTVGVDEDEEQPIVWCWEGTVFVHRKLVSWPGFPIEAPRRHPGLERGLEGRDQLLILVEGPARESQELRGGLAGR
jgi:hypothetical protein